MKRKSALEISDEIGFYGRGVNELNFLQTVEKYLTEQGYEYLGAEGGLLFFKDKNGKVWGASEESVVRKMNSKLI